MKYFARIALSLSATVFFACAAPTSVPIYTPRATATVTAPGVPATTSLPPVTLTPPLVEQLAQLGKGTVESAVWSPDGKRLIVVGSMGLRLYDAMTFGEVQSVAFSPDGTILVSGGLDGTIRLWRVKTP